MVPVVFQEWSKLLRAHKAGDRVLEIGAVPTDHSLLNLPEFDGCRERIGINFDSGESYGAGAKSSSDRYKIIKGNSNNMSMFPESYFDTVVSNSVIEHDKFFWLSLKEIRRVAKPGALVIIMSPGYDELENVRLDTWKSRLRRLLVNKTYFLTRGTTTLFVHSWPGDYYRFSPDCYKEVIMKGMRDVTVYSFLIPPRIVGIGFNDK